MRAVAIIQARLGSTRLPGKVLLSLGKHSVLGHVINRCNAIDLVDEVIVATTTDSNDLAIVEECRKYNIKSYRGSEEDVLSRYYEAALEYGADTIVRVTSDCPLIDPDVSNNVIEQFYADSPLDYCSNGLKRSFPRGLDTEVFTFDALKYAYVNAKKEFEREHVTPYLYQNPDKFRISNVENETDLSHYRWTLDSPEDWLLIQEIYKRLNLNESVSCSWKDVALLMKEFPELSRINAHIEQKKLGE